MGKRQSQALVGKTYNGRVYTRRPPAVRFWAKVRKTSRCWLWQGSVNNMGYGKFGLPELDDNRGWILAHHWAFLDAIGDIPKGCILLHSCDTPRCVNPAHLRVGSHKENSRDAARKGRLAHGERHPAAKMTTKQVLLARKQRAAGWSLKRLCETYGFASTGSMSQLVRGKKRANG